MAESVTLGSFILHSSDRMQNAQNPWSQTRPCNIHTHIYIFIYMTNSSDYQVYQLGQNRSWRDKNEGVLCIPQTSWSGTSPSDCLVSNQEMHLVYSPTPADWALCGCIYITYICRARYIHIHKYMHCLT